MIDIAFYYDLSSYYDDIFPVKAAMKEFILASLLPKRVLNVGCATGNLERAIEYSGDYELTGLDLEPAMIRKAHAMLSEESTVRFKVGNMLELQFLFPQAYFDNLLCLGNTLPHLSSIEEMAQFLESAKEVLSNTSRIVLQIMNYDRILQSGTMSFPLLSTRRIEFKRSYEPAGEKVLFNTEIKELATDEIFRNSVLLYPLRREELTQLLESAGFTNLKWFGAYNGEEWNLSSYHTIVTADRKL